MSVLLITNNIHKLDDDFSKKTLSTLESICFSTQVFVNRHEKVTNYQEAIIFIFYFKTIFLAILFSLCWFSILNDKIPSVPHLYVLYENQLIFQED